MGGGEGLFFFLPAAGREGLVTLFEWGPKARVCCWARAVDPEGFRRVGGMLCGWVRWSLGDSEEGGWWVCVCSDRSSANGSK